MKKKRGSATTEKESTGGIHSTTTSKSKLANEFYRLGYQTMGLAAAKMQMEKDNANNQNQLLEATKQLMALSAQVQGQAATAQVAQGQAAGQMAGMAQMTGMGTAGGALPPEQPPMM